MFVCVPAAPSFPPHRSSICFALASSSPFPGHSFIPKLISFFFHIHPWLHATTSCSPLLPSLIHLLSPSPFISSLDHLHLRLLLPFSFLLPCLSSRILSLLSASMLADASSGFFSESSEDQASLLPRHTKVVVTGNNRTKSVLVGLHGVVKKAVGLGGWHWLVLTNGLEVKLQRNALSVLEPPTGLEEEENDSEDGIDSNVLEDHQRPFRTRNRSQNAASSSVKIDHASHVADISCIAGSESGHRKVDISKLETDALLRYWKRFKLVEAGLGPHSSKEELVDAVERHLRTQFQTWKQQSGNVVPEAIKLMFEHGGISYSTITMNQDICNPSNLGQANRDIDLHDNHDNSFPELCLDED